MVKTAKYFTLLFFIQTTFLGFSIDSTKVKMPTKQKIFANIFTAAYYNLGTKKPNLGFELSTALLGYRYTKGDKLAFTLIYDVTRTTNGFKVTDIAGNNLPISYFEGSKYTAFLKMAEIKWKFAPRFYLSAGQLLNEQYLTVQDKFWGHRYVMTTMQEMNRMGMPADFGIRLNYVKKKSFCWSLGANNGNGPFRHQDTLSIIEYTSNVQYYPTKNLMLKFFTGQTPNITTNKIQSIYAAFIAYSQKKYKLGIEYSYTQNPHFVTGNYAGLSVFAIYNWTQKIQSFVRYDYIDHSSVVDFGNMLLLGMQYQIENNLYIAANYRFWAPTSIQQLYLSFGAKF
jgi:hypothetical protein